VVIDGNLICAAGTTAGVDGALRVAAELRGPETAQLIQLHMQYAPEPPFNTGSPKTAPAAILERARQAVRQITEQRQRTAQRAAWRLHVRLAPAETRSSGERGRRTDVVELNGERQLTTTMQARIASPSKSGCLHRSRRPTGAAAERGIRPVFSEAAWNIVESVIIPWRAHSPAFGGSVTEQPPVFPVLTVKSACLSACY